MKHTSNMTTTMNTPTADTTMNTAYTDTTMNTTAPNSTTSRMKMLIKSIPARFHSKLILSLEALQKSDWYRKVADPQTMGILLVQAEQWLLSHPASSPVYRHLLKIVTVLQQMNRNGQLFTKRNALILAAVVLYTISPADAVPDVLPAIGMLDDLLLLILGIRFMQGDTQDAANANIH